MEIERYQIKKNSIGVSESKMLIDATIPFQTKPWGYEKMKNPDEKVDIGAFHDAKKLYLGGGGGIHLHVNNNQIIIQPHILTDDDMVILHLHVHRICDPCLGC